MNWVLAVLLLVVVTCIPALELRASIPLGFFALDPACRKVAELLGMAWTPCPMSGWVVALICIAANVVLGIVVYELLAPGLHALRRWKWFDRRVWPRVEKRREKLRPLVEKYGEPGLALFIGVPLPGTGAVTGAVGAFLLGFSRHRFYVANALGVLLAGVCVTVLCALIFSGVIAEDSLLRRLFIKEL